MSFVRRFQSFPGAEVITAIEGIVVVDLPPPGAIQGVGTGRVLVIGEFADMTYAVAVSSVGAVSTSHRAVQVFGGTDLLEQLGGFDETLGQFGGDWGNGFCSLRNKKFASLVCMPINLASTRGVRVWRQLPTCISATNPSPIVPIAAGVVLAGREFRSGNDRVRIGKRHVFTAGLDFARGTDGSVTALGAPAATQVFNAAGGAFIVNGVAEGDILVVGRIGGAGALGANAATYRVVSVAATALTVELMTGANFDWTTGATLPWRVHPAAAGDSGADHQLSEAAGYLIPARPLDSTITAATTLAPTVVPTAGDGNNWDSLSGLSMRTMPGGTDLVFDTNVQASNAPNHASIDALYTNAIAASIRAVTPLDDVAIVVASRKSSQIAADLRTMALNASAAGKARFIMTSPQLSDVLSVASAIAAAHPGVGAYRNERHGYAWPGVQTSIPEAVGFALATADGNTTDDGKLDVPFDEWVAAVLSNLAPERNPGQAADPVPTVFSPILDFQRGLTSTLGLGEYITLRQQGIMAPRFHQVTGTTIQSGVTTSLTSGEKNVNRRRFADFFEDSVAGRLVNFSKLPLTDRLKDAIDAEIVAFCDSLLSPNNPAAQRIAGYEVDSTSGNTPDLEAQGIYVVIGRVRMLATGDFLVFQAEVGTTVTVTTT